MIQAGFTEEAAWSPVSTHDALGAGLRTRSGPGQRGGPSEGRQAVVWTEARGWETPGPTWALRALR